MLYTVMSPDKSDTVLIEDDLLVSGPNSGQASLQITAQEEFGINQTLVLLVRVSSFLSTVSSIIFMQLLFNLTLIAFQFKQTCQNVFLIFL